MKRHERRGGFTLIELLVVVILMIIIVGIVSSVFATSKEIVARNEARTLIYVNAGFAMEKMQGDWFGCLPYNGSQRFILHNYIVNGAADLGRDFHALLIAPTPEESGGHYLQGSGAGYSAAADVVSFRTVTVAGDVVGTYQVTYYLKGDPQAGSVWKTFRTDRPIFTLMRRTTIADAPAETVSTNWTKVPTVDGDGDPATVDPVPLQEEEICHYVLSFNVEYFAGNMNFSQLQPSPCPWADPLGNGDVTTAGVPDPAQTNDRDDDLDPLTTADNPIRITAVRITMVVLDDNGERAERVVSHVFEIPMG